MVGQHAAKLAAGIISSHFGDLVAKVCGCLLQHGTLSLQEIVRFTDMMGSNVKNCLLVLIQHNCVQAFSIPRKGSTDKTVTQYMAIFDNIINRMRFSKFLSVVKDDLALEVCENDEKMQFSVMSHDSNCTNPGATDKTKKKAEVLFEGLIQNGRLTFEQLVERSISKGQHMDQAMRENHRSKLRACFNKLVRWHYVERCPRPEPFIDPDSEDQPKPTKRRGTKIVEQPPSLEQQAFEAATLAASERFSEIPESSVESAEDGTGNHSSAAGDKRKHETLERDLDLVVAIAEKEVLWRVNFEKLLYCLKTKICAENIRSRLGVDAGVVLEAIMEANTEQKIKDAIVSATLDRILDRLRDKPGGISMTLDHVRTILDELHCKQSTEKLEAIYSLDLNGTLEACQNDEIEALVKARYGDQGYKIFRLLSTRGQLIETDRIAEITFVEKKEAHQMLYRLWKDEYIESKKIQSQGSRDSANIFLWRLDRKAFSKTVLDDIFHAALNLTEKISQLVEKQHEILENEMKKLIQIKTILQLSLLKIDDSLLLFHDFSK
ncbi:DNA-directed RNA polymerase III subunit rpc3 [Carex littledalei]|uniref:DNA-directed RNA polymerase III subunit RPC3 n=1 Tax=Carex littledalei TaxID=544730 RepID=A0A833VD76_9POAL|nr:DNA-directed RNA polymerase III subunit rpc3 [Carex littledalei]